MQTIVAAPLDAVWSADTSPDAIIKWNTASDEWHTVVAAVDLREGGAFSSHMEANDGSICFDFAGTHTRVIPSERIDYVWGAHCPITFAEMPAGVEVVASFDGEQSHSEQQQRAGWQPILDNFRRYVDARY